MKALNSFFYAIVDGNVVTYGLVAAMTILSTLGYTLWRGGRHAKGDGAWKALAPAFAWLVFENIVKLLHLKEMTTWTIPAQVELVGIVISVLCMVAMCVWAAFDRSPFCVLQILGNLGTLYLGSKIVCTFFMGVGQLVAFVFVLALLAACMFSTSHLGDPVYDFGGKDSKYLSVPIGGSGDYAMLKVFTDGTAFDWDGNMYRSDALGQYWKV